MSFFRGLAGFLSWGLCLVLAGISVIIALILYLLDQGLSFIEINSGADFTLYIGIASGAACLFTILGFALLMGLTRDNDDD
ncbi:MAG: hypothetical protein QF372_02170 [Candidatus Poseidoniia archaeon]|jgi:hypothetical protein|nr:hypothetical protein [Candidatus Poseidoniia archaeon]MDP7082140.1 hypothetical protein [Candidatus Poseidoniia archaeon]MDP7473480.1 hypothetical protein [Candidatus Poseidoniia archaeon]HJO28808.1 hypothetical protein [Candidatus Poseidoniia archaeon]|tara:strand:+ start:454 stop:696 length:243 start_codon:yes stop_codon:yes gene_type:complete